MKPMYAIAALSVATLLSCSSVTKDKQSPKPNILFIVVDDLNDWVGCMKGNPHSHDKPHYITQSDFK